jgi:two-component system CheB/CheR fusion protein
MGKQPTSGVSEKESARLIAVSDCERRRVARELHDDISQRLALLADDADRLRREANLRNEASVERLDQLVEQARALSDDLRRISHRLHPAIVQDLGVSVALRSLTADFSERTGMTADFSERNVPLFLPPDISTAVYRIVQEALRNVTKHAGQTSVLVKLDVYSDELVLFISDLGAGFDATNKPGLGLITMRERAYLAGGAFSVVSSLGIGTTVQVRLPLMQQMN